MFSVSSAVNDWLTTEILLSFGTGRTILNKKFSAQTIRSAERTGLVA
jgi:hypothetical protein